MQINFLGDSITAGAGAEIVPNMFSYLVCEHFKAKENNFGVCGTRIARQIRKTDNPDDDYFMNRAVKMPKDADFTFVFGGTNDYGHGDAVIGKEGDTDVYTFYGAFDELAKYMHDNFSTNRVCFILPLPRYDQDNPFGDGSKLIKGEPLSSYIEMEKDILQKYGIDILDLSDLFPIPKSNKGDDLTMDGLHPNPKGYRLIADKLIDYLENRHLS